MPWIAPLENRLTFLRYGVAIVVLVVAPFVMHKWLPAGHRRLRDILPGVFVTLMLWVICGMSFGRYLAEFAYTYVTYYAGLASAMIALVFLYFTSLIFVYGGEFNHAFHNHSPHKYRNKLRKPREPAG